DHEEGAAGDRSYPRGRRGQGAAGKENAFSPIRPPGSRARQERRGKELAWVGPAFWATLILVSALLPGPMRAAVKISIVSPVFDEEPTLRILHAEIARTMEGTGVAWEVLYVDDRSRDGSLRVML